MKNNRISFLPKNYFIYGLFILAILIVYGQTLFFNYALDDHLIRDHIPGRADGLTGILQLFFHRYNEIDYRPIGTFTYALEKWIFGESNPHVSHLINLMLYSFLAIIIYSTVLLFLNSDTSKKILLFSVLLFIVHPIHAEVVCSLKNRDNLLSMLFTVLSARYIFRYFYLEKKISFLLLGWLFFIIAFLSKLDAAGLILFVPAVLWITKRVNFKKSLIFFLVLFMSLLFIRYMLADKYIPVDTSVPHYISYTENPLAFNFTITNRIIAACLSFWYYLKLLVIPFGYRYYYGFAHIRLYSISQWQGILSLLTASIVLIFIVRYIKKETTILLILSGYLLFILYALNMVAPVAGIIADRYAFIASLFFCAGAAYLLLVKITKEKKQLYIASILLTILSISCIYRASAWKNKLTLIERDATYLSNSYEAMRIAASTFMEYSDKEQDPATKKILLDKAIVCAQNGNSVYPNNVVLHVLQATAYFKEGNMNDAKQQFHISIANDTSQFESYNFLGDIFYTEKNSDSAFYYYNKAFERHHNDPVLISNISTILYEEGKKEECLEFNHSLLAKNDSLYAAWENLGYFYLAERDTLKASYYFEKGFGRGLDNPEAAQMLINYFKRKDDKTKVLIFARYR